MNVLYAVGQGRRESAVSPESGPDILPAGKRVHIYSFTALVAYSSSSPTYLWYRSSGQSGGV